MTVKRRRIPTVDIVRGMLMVLIICTHALGNQDPTERSAGLVGAMCNILNGTVGFATISGALIGYFLITRADNLRRVFRSYAKRAVVLVLIAHPLISLALLGPDGGSRSFLYFTTHTLFITDDLAFIFLLLVPLTPRLSARTRLGLGVLLMVLGRLILLMPTPNFALLLTRELLAGVDSGPTILISNYPLLAITGMFLIGSWIGHEFAVAEASGRLNELARKMWIRGIWLLGVGGAMGAAWAACKWHVGGLEAPSVRKFFYPDYDFSGYPGYLAGTLFLMAVFVPRETVGRVEKFFLIFGRASLFTYVAHYYVVQTIPWLLNWHHRMHLWQLTLYLVLVLPLLHWAAILYGRLTKKPVTPTPAPLPGPAASA